MKPVRFCAIAIMCMWSAVYVGCGQDGGSITGSNDVEDAAVVRSGKAVVPAAVSHADVVVQVLGEGGGLEVSFGQSVAGQVSQVRWNGTTDATGIAHIVVDVSDLQVRKSSATGYYVAHARNAAGQIVGQWHSIPIEGGVENALTLTIGGRAQIHRRGPRVTVMTRNVYLGADINRILAPPDPEIPIPLLVAQTWGMVQQTNFAERARALAEEIAAKRPHLIGLQEVSLFRIQNPGDFLVGNPVAATEVAVDFLDILLNELAARRLHYRAVAVAEGIDIELPMATGQTTPLADIRMTDREVILAREDVKVGDVVTKQFDAKVPVALGGISIQIPRAWAMVKATVAGRQISFMSTHLETGAIEPIQRMQGQELMQVIGAETMPVVLVGDFNSDANGTTTQTYSDLTGAGLVDVWSVARPGDPGLTGSQKEDLRNSPSTLSRRIDLIFTRGVDDWGVLNADVVGDEESDRTPSGMWPSDHAGVSTTLRLPIATPF